VFIVILKLNIHYKGVLPELYLLKTSENYQSQFYQVQRQAFNPRFGEAISFVESVNREHFSTTGFARSLRLIHSRHFSAQKILGLHQNRVTLQREAELGRWINLLQSF
jgi:hypothetical protein